ncbi:MAG: PIN domain-containing protein [Gammaproteobacteria bacterium]|nr:PIN domain-containing protein [Gammaproteobacteria bacterium]
MCAILDANVASEIFGKRKSRAGEEFRKWLDSGSSALALVSGGKLADELKGNAHFRGWSRTAIQYGRFRLVDRAEVETQAAKLRQSRACISDDEHIIALAQISHARLLFSNDANLHKDFKDKSLIHDPEGKIYSTLKNKDFTPSKKRLLADGNLCVTDK